MTDKTFLILGGYGNTGRLISRLLLQETGVRLVIAGRNIERAKETAAGFNRDFPGERVMPAYADASDIASLRSVFQGIDLVVVASSTVKYTRQVAQTALEENLDYLDVLFSTKKVAVLKSMSTEIEIACRCFITDGGFHPGLPAALVRFAALGFDRLEKAQVGSVIKQDWKSLAVEGATMDEPLEELNDFQMVLYKEGQWRKASLVSTADYLKMDFGREFGMQLCAPMFLEEMRLLPSLYPSLQETGFFVGGFNWFVDWVVMPLALGVLKISPRRTLRPMGSLMRWGLNTFSKPPYATMLKVEASGMKDGIARTRQVTLYHPDGYVFTAVPVVACLLQYLDGLFKKPGLWTQALIVDPTRLMKDMERLGIEVMDVSGPQ